MIEWRRVPWTLWVHAAISLAGVIAVEIRVHGPVPPRVFYPVFIFAWLFFLLKGVRWLWIATVVVLVLGFMITVVTEPRTWYGLGLGLVTVALLLLPVTRRYFARERAAADA